MAMAARRERGLLDPDAAAGQQPVRPLHLLLRLRRRHGGGHQPRGGLPRRPPAARQPHRAVRRQQHLHRGRHQHRQVRGRRRPVRGVRLARAAAELGTGGRLPRGRAGRCTTRSQTAQADDDGTVVHLAAHDHRLARAAQAEHRRGPRRGARRRRGGGDQEDPRLRPGGRIPGRGRARRRTRARSRDRGKQAHAAWDEQFAAWSNGTPAAARAVRPAERAAAAGRLDRRAAGVPARREGRRDQEGIGRRC